MAIFAATYPGLDWRKMTVSVFEKHLREAQVVRMLLDGTMGDEAKTKFRIRQDRLELFTKLKFPSFFPDEEL